MGKKSVGQIAREFNDAWSEGERPRIELFLMEVDPDQRHELARGLLEIEIRRRVTAGESPTLADYSNLDETIRDAAQELLRSDETDPAVTNTYAAVSGSFEVGVGATRALGKDDEFFIAANIQQNPGDMIGPYRLTEVLGEGGMGTVWLAEQTEPVRRRVAVKVIKRGMNTERVVSSFEAERQTLALMSHANIAQVLDAGKTDAGQLFFAMELVDGIPLNKFCDKHQVSIPDRLRLFVQICHAVQHAHQKSIIHRDLKPSNVLVGLQDGRPIPKVIDFGLAEVLSENKVISDKPSVSVFGQVAGTLQYMSPEQAKLEVVDTRADVYSLGCILFELMTGSIPLDSGLFKLKTIDREGISRILEAIGTSDAPRPSARLASFAEERVDEIAGKRETSPSKLKNVLHEDLDWIILKALERERDSRYATASGLAEDIERFLSHDPVMARPASSMYSARKFARKHRGLLTSLAAIACFLIAGITASTWFAYSAHTANLKAQEATGIAQEESQRAQRESERAQTANLETQAAMRQVVEAKERAETEKVRADKAAENAQAQSQVAFSTLSSFVNDVNQYSDLGPQVVQRKLLESILSKLKDVKTDYISQKSIDRGTMIALANYGDLIRRFGNDASGNADSLNQAMEFYQQAFAVSEKIAAEQDSHDAQVDLVKSSRKIGSVYLDLAKPGDALVYFDKCLEVATASREKYPESEWFKSTTVALMVDRGRGLDRLGKRQLAYECFAEASELGERLLKETAEPNFQLINSVQAAREGYSGIVLEIGATEQAIERLSGLFKKSIELAEKDPDNPALQSQLAEMYGRMGNLYFDVGELDKALAQCEKRVSIKSGLYKRAPNDLSACIAYVGALDQMASVYLKLGDIRKKEDLMLQQYTLNKRMSASHPDDVRALRTLHRSIINLAEHFLDIRRFEDGKNMGAEAVEIGEALVKKVPGNLALQVNLIRSYSTLSSALRILGRMEGSLFYAQKALQLSKEVASDASDTPEAKIELSVAYTNLGNLYGIQKKPTQAENCFLKSLDISYELSNGGNRECERNLALGLSKLAYHYNVVGKYEAAIDGFQQAIEIFEQLSKGNTRDIELRKDMMKSLEGLSIALEATEKFDDIEPVLQKSVELRLAIAQQQSDVPEFWRLVVVGYVQLGDYYVKNRKTIAKAEQAYNTAVKYSTGMLKRGEMPELVREYREEARVKASGARFHLVSFGDWDSLMKAPAQRIPELLNHRATQFIFDGRIEDAVMAVTAIIDLEQATQKELYRAARTLVECVSVQEKIDEKEGAESKAELIAQWKTDAVTLLELSVQRGWTNLEFMRADAGFAPLRDLPAFKKLLDPEDEDEK